MRLIDADGLVDMIREHSEKLNNEEIKKFWLLIISIVNTMPTVIDEETIKTLKELADEPN